MTSPSPRRSSSAPVINIEQEGRIELEGTSPHPLSSMKSANSKTSDDQSPEEPVRPPQQASQPHRRQSRPTESHPHRRRRPHRSPGVAWKEKWTDESFRDGRVLILDYVSRDFSEDGRRRVLANEFHEIDQLRRFYNTEAHKRTPALRVIHVQNSWWARRFLLRKFNIDPTDDLVGMSFGKWAAFTTPQRRAGKPLLNGKAFRNQRDPWRGISRCAFGMDVSTPHVRVHPVQCVMRKCFRQLDLC